MTDGADRIDQNTMPQAESPVPVLHNIVPQAESPVAVRLYIPSEGALLVAQKGMKGGLAREEAAEGWQDYVNLAVHRYFGTEFEEYSESRILLGRPFEEVYPEGCAEKLAKDAVAALYGSAEYEFL